MKRWSILAWLAAMATLTFSARAETLNRAPYEQMVATHARANQVPEALVHRVIVRESKYHPELIGRGGTIGLMQIKVATARGVGYTGDAEGLRDPETNLRYGIKYLAGAWRAAEGDHDRAVRLYAKGYYDVAKRQRLERLRHPEAIVASALPRDTEEAKAAAVAPQADSVEAATPAAEPEPAAPPKRTRATVRQRSTAKPSSGPLVLTPVPTKLRSTLTPSPKADKGAHKKLADAKERVPRPPAGMAATPSDGANAAKPR